ncbi:MAG: flagellar biosynthesis protein FliQ [Planctomycetes bacterium]|nr:flagellar biosynthesis protein FliQ [Planctomycetota bacterium]MBI3835290.1 flagellar biosynthesis protein FliQ [Planctomycetota bacterium]
MDLNTALEIGRHAFWMTLIVAAPILVIGLLVGLCISLFQAVTQLQEQSLTFVPKIAAMVVAAVLFIPWIAGQMVEYTKQMLGPPAW